MHSIFTRVIESLLWLQKRLKSVTERRFGRPALLLFTVLSGTLLTASPAYAQDGPGIVDRFILFLADIALTIANILSKIVIMIIEVMIPVMLYNNFSNSQVVSAGWAIVRDTVNMFFVIVLIAIAFGTIFGHSKFKWQQQVPRLLIFAIVINFSKTLTGLMIDFGQVVMLTFANALSQIAAGNFVQLLGFTDIYTISTKNNVFSSAQSSASASGPSPFDFLASAVAAVFMMVVVLGTMLVLLVILMYRIVMLWIMIVLAPLAWFVGGAKDVITSKAYDEWWTRFKCLVAIGPVLTFFLWLTLAVAGAGSIASSSGFDTSGPAELSNAGNFLTSIFELDRFMSFIIGIAMLFAGFEAAQSVCSSMPGVKNGFNGFRKGVGQAARFTAGAGARVTAFTARKTGSVVRSGARVAGRNLAPKVENVKGLRLLTKKGRSDLYRNVARGAGTGALGKTVGVAAARRAEALGKARTDEIANAGKKYKDDSKSTKLDQLRRFAETGHLGAGGKREAQALFKEALGDKNMQKQLRNSGHIEQLFDRYGKSMEEDFKGDAETTAKLKNFRKSNADLFGEQSEIKNVEDVRNLSAAAFGDAAIRKQIDGDEAAGIAAMTYRDTKGNELSVRDAILSGKMGAEAKAAYEKGSGAIYDNMSDADLAGADYHDIAMNASSEATVRAMELAARDGDTGKMERIIEALGDKFQLSEGAGGTERFDVAVKMDNVQAAMRDMLISNSAGLNNSGQARLENAMTALEQRRAGSEAMAGTITNDGQVRGGFGTIPPISDQPDPSKFIRDSFSNASDERLADAAAQISTQLAGSMGRANEIDSQINDMLGAESASLKEEIEKLSADMAEARNKFLQEQGAKGNLSAATFDQADQLPEVVEIRAQQQALIEQEASLEPAQIEGLEELVEELAALRGGMDGLNAAQSEIAAIEKAKRNPRPTA